MNRLNKNIALWLGVVLVFVLLINLFSQPRVKRDELNFSEFLDLIEKGEVSLNRGKLEDNYDQTQILEITAVVGLFNYINRFNDALRVLPEKI